MRGKKKRWLGHVVLSFVWMAIFGLLSSVYADETWWNEDWQYRKKLKFDTTTAGADVSANLNDVQVLVRLHSGNLNFTNAKETGEDIRFVAADDKTLLSHHIENYDGIDEIALVWVKIPRLAGASAADFVWMYYGNDEAVGGQDSRATFGNKGVVYHFSEMEGTPKDSTANGIDPTAFSGGQGMPSVIGRGVSLNGMSDNIVIPGDTGLDMSGGFTFSAWINIPTAIENAVLFDRGGESGRLTIGIDNSHLYCSVIDETGNMLVTEKTADLEPGRWQPVVVTGTPGGVVAVHVDGIKIDWINLNRGLPQFKGDITIGSSKNGEQFYVGEIDEVRIYPMALPYDRIRLDFANQGPDRTFITAGTEDVSAGGGMPIFYLATVFKNITLDGWLVIISLMILGVLSWGVILTKGIQFHQMRKENNLFKELKNGNTKEFTVFKGDEEDFQNSSLFRVFIVGKDALKNVFSENETKKPLSSKQIDYLKSELEKSLVEETSQMNSWLMILTMSISGGPFLGLLGTVWGVMNTFAAMAEAGEANIMAIAPGVASALSTTVFGLIVAIPALFGYNFLSTQIRKFTIDLSLYVDDFGLLADRKYGGKA